MIVDDVNPVFQSFNYLKDGCRERKVANIEPRADPTVRKKQDERWRWASEDDDRRRANDEAGQADEMIL